MLELRVPERLDAVGIERLAHGLAAVGDASVVVLAGEPERFCRGMDFAEVMRGDVHARLTQLADLIGALATCPRPTMAVVDGAALGGGLGIAAACDYVLASDRSRFGLPEALYGLAPAIIRPALDTRITPGQLRVMLFTGYSRTAFDAARLGLVDEVVQVDALQRARATAVRQLARTRTSTIVVARRWQRGLAEALRAGVEETATALQDPAVRAALVSEVPLT